MLPIHSRWPFLALALAALAAPAAADDAPNIVLIFADDLGVETLGAYGGTSYETPHLDRLAASGVRFEHAHAMPLCTPSRVQLMTGKYSFRNYEAFSFMRPGERTFAHVLKDAGYDTCVVGKWQLCGDPRRRALSGRTGTTPAQAGFDRWCLWQLTDTEGSRFKDPVLSIDDLERVVHRGEYGPDVFCRYAQEFMAREREGPFLLYYPMVFTHAPFQPTPGQPAYESFDPQSGRSDRALFGDNVAYMDEIVGRLIATLEETGQRENTLVLFLGDNGTDRGITSLRDGREVRGRKGYPVDAGTHVPLLASWPRAVPGGRVSEDLVDLTDFLPTLVEVAGARRSDVVHLEGHLDGHSLVPTLRGTGRSAREWVFCHYDPRWSSFKKRRWVHDRRWKLYGDGRLFDLETDPREREPILPAARDDEARAAVARFQAVLDELRPEPARRPPNVVLILTDDQGSVDMGAYGAGDLRTPAMDRLAARGLRFTQLYAGAPVCSPSRACLLTGRSPQAAGVPGNVAPGPGHGLPPEQITLAEVLGAAGYRTAQIGKWHLGDDAAHRPAAQGFDYWFGHLGGCIDNWSHFFYWNGPNRHDLWRNGEEVFQDGQYFPDLMLNEARQFVISNRAQPFFLYLAVNNPHYPYQGDAERLREYRERGVPYPRDLYGAFLSSIDARIGKLLDQIDRLGLTEDTIVILQSDHGHSTELRAHGGGGSAGPYRGAKFSLLEGGIRVPAVISWPGQLGAGEVRDQVALAADWLPTVLELCGLAPVEHPIAGRSLVPLLRDPDATSPHDVLHWQRGKHWAVRRGDWKLLFEPHDTSASSRAPENAPEDRLFLVDLSRDLGERTNLASREPEIVEELRRLHEEWIATGY